MIDKAQIDIYKSLFKGREDVFAIRWEKGNKSGYMPSYQFDPYQYRLHSAKGGSFKDFKDKTYKPLSDDQITKHLRGEQLIGLYPLLTDNTSFFIAADFDKENWRDKNYGHLWRIEKAFRVAKTDIKIRPIYHQLPHRIEAHICIAFVAYKIYKELERQLN